LRWGGTNTINRLLAFASFFVRVCIDCTTGPDALTTRSGELVAPVPVWRLVDQPTANVADGTKGEGAVEQLYHEYKHIVTTVLLPHLTQAGVTQPRLDWVAAEEAKHEEAKQDGSDTHTAPLDGSGSGAVGGVAPGRVLDVTFAIHALVAELVTRKRFDKGLAAVLAHRDDAVMHGMCPVSGTAQGGHNAAAVEVLREY
jgi:hypothetical protein